MPPLLTYEKICRLLTKAAKRVGLHVYGEEHIIEFHTMGRSFEFFCVPKGYGPPYNRRARISFFWPSEQHVRVYSVEDEEGETDEPEDASDASDSSDAEDFDDLSYIELVVDYDIVGTRDEQEFDGVMERAEAAFELITETIKHDNQPVLHSNLGMQPGGKKFVEQCYVTYYWEVDIFEGDFDTANVFDEVREVLKLLIENDNTPGPGREGKSPRPRFPRFSDN